MAAQKHEYVLTVMSDDHPGIVAAVSGAMESLGGNIEECSQTVVGGYFTLIMIVSLPKSIECGELAEMVRQSETSGRGFQVLAQKSLPDASAESAEQHERFVFTAFGPDQPGITRRFSQYMAGKDINIVDLYGGVRGSEFVLIGQVEIPSHWDVRLLQTDLEQMGDDLGFTVKLQHENVFVATNQLRLDDIHRS